MSKEDICYLSATEALARFRLRKLSPVELMQAIIERAENIEPSINAFSATFYERALEQAKKSEARYMRKGARLRALEGLPLAVKDEVPVKGDPHYLRLARAQGRRGGGNCCVRAAPVQCGRHLSRAHDDTGIQLRRYHA